MPRPSNPADLSYINAHFVLQSTVSALAAASTVVQRDSHANSRFNTPIAGVSWTTTDDGALVLNSASAPVQYIDGTIAGTVTLPDARTLPVRQWYYIANRGSADVTLNTNDGVFYDTVSPNQSYHLILIDSSTQVGTWEYDVPWDYVNITGGTIVNTVFTQGGTFQITDSGGGNNPTVLLINHTATSPATITAGFGGRLIFTGNTLTTAGRNMGTILGSWADPGSAGSDATRKGRLTLIVYNAGTQVNALILDTTTATFPDGYSIVGGSSTGLTILSTSSQKLGFFGKAPVVRQTTYTQTYATTATTMAAYTTNAQSSAYTGINNAQAGTVYAQLSDLNLLRAAYENLRASDDTTKQLVNKLIDDLQAYGLAA